MFFSKEIDKIGEPALMLKGACVKEGITQKELADRLGISQVYISQLENGRKEINKSLIKELEKIFNINYSLLGKNSLIKCLLYFSFHRDIFVNNASILLNYFFLADYIRCFCESRDFLYSLKKIFRDISQ